MLLKAYKDLALPNGTPVDLYDDNLLTANMKGDTTRTKHDGMVHQIYMETKEAFPATQHQPGDSIRYVNGGGQSMMPDMATIYKTNMIPFDLKTLTDNPSINFISVLRECHSKPCSVEKRQKEVDKEFIRKAQAIDSRNGVQGPGHGPVLAYLQSFGRVHGLVIGARGEASSDLHALVEKVCMKKAEELVQETGYTLQAAKAVVKRWGRLLSNTTCSANASAFLSS